MTLNRRHMLKLLASSTFFLSVGARAANHPAKGVNLHRLAFPQGVASGDPQPDGIMLWTRAQPQEDTGSPVNLLLQLSADKTFTEAPLMEAVLQAKPETDFTVRAYVDGLSPGQQYYYRFLGAENSASRIGRTRTAPDPDDATPVNFAFTSCQNFEQAFYGGWARMLKDDRAQPEEQRLHFILHLGDFIYERCWHTRIDGSPQSRTVPPFPDGVTTDENRYAISLADYRHLYHTYLDDPHLQDARANWPFICTWDDHEFANNAFQAYSTYADKALLEPQRKQDANQAWFEYIPTVLSQLKGQPAHDFTPENVTTGDDRQRNEAAVDSLCIYRKLNWGKHVDILLTDGRSYRSPACLPTGLSQSLGLPMDTVKLVAIADAGAAYNGGNPPANLPYGDGDTANPARERAPGSMLGRQQQEWLLDTLAGSRATWKLWGNAMPLIPMRLDTASLPFLDYEDTIYNIDGWAGYPHEQMILMDEVEARGISGIVSFSGDHHLHAAGTINRSASEPDAAAVAVDFTIGGISSSPVFKDIVEFARGDHGEFSRLVYREDGEELEPVWHITMLQGVLAGMTYSRSSSYSLARWLGPNPANTGLQYMDTTTNGYGLARMEAKAVKVVYKALEDCTRDFETPPAIRYTATFELPAWTGEHAPELTGPIFAGDAPFPFTSKDS